MGLISVAGFKPKPGKEAELMAVIEDRIPLLRRLGLATSREPVLMRSRDGTIIQVSEWTSEEAIAKAHETPEVLELWGRFDACCTYIKLEALPESRDDFATFKAVEQSDLR